jgi:CRP/FNR family transcriptional regulator
VSRRGTVVGTVGPGAYFGELSLIDGEPRSAEVVAGDDGLQTFALTKWSFEALMEEHPEVAVPMLRVMTARLRRAEADNG